MKKSLLALLAGIVFVLGACTTPPPADIIAAIQNACVIDAGIRPTITALEPLATPFQVLIIKSARSVIDPICANPSGSVQANTPHHSCHQYRQYPRCNRRLANWSGCQVNEIQGSL